MNLNPGNVRLPVAWPPLVHETGITSCRTSVVETPQWCLELTVDGRGDEPEEDGDAWSGSMQLWLMADEDMYLLWYTEWNAGESESDLIAALEHVAVSSGMVLPREGG